MESSDNSSDNDQLQTSEDLDKFLESLPSVDEIHERISQAMDKLTWTSKDGSVNPCVCALCDEYIISERHLDTINADVLQKYSHLLEWETYEHEDDDFDGIPDGIQDYFHFDNGDPIPHVSTLFAGMGLSPRTTLSRPSLKGKYKVHCCKQCKTTFSRGKIPYYAIVNRNFVGCAPECLLELTDIELALVTPIKTFGYCFTYTGGKQQNLRGALSFMRVKERSTARAVLQTEALGLTKHVIVLVNGNMTPDQHAKCRNKATVRTDKLIAAVEWLCENNIQWREVDLNEIRVELAGIKPVFVDMSKPCAAENANVEEQELFQCYYPDASVNGRDGGFEKPEAFRKYVEEMKKKGFDVEFQCNLQKSFATDGGDSLMNSCILQFPYGVGCFEESRFKQDGTRSKNLDIPSYMKHLSKLSQPVFQKPLFQLVLFNFMCKQTLLRTSMFQVKDDLSAKTIADGINLTSLDHAIRQRREGNYQGGNSVASKLLDACKNTSRALPHTNEAATQARSSGETLHHYFGTGSIWLTVTFDDKNSWLMQVFSGIVVDDGRPVSELTDEECRQRCKHREEIRMDFPGLSALTFELQLEILLKHVIGWDTITGTATEQAGYFGEVLALIGAVEEQARKTLHTHLTIWLRKYKGIQKKLFFGTKNEKRLAKSVMTQFHERISNTEMMPLGRNGKMHQRAFPHDCCEKVAKRKAPIICDDQQLRNLRNRNGHKANPSFAHCPHCGFTWKYEDMLCSYLVHHENIHAPNLDLSEWIPTDQAIPNNRLHAIVVQHQQKPYERGTVPKAAINAAYNHHLSCHVRGCFKCSKLKKSRKHKCGPLCDCRYKLPDRKRRRTTLNAVKESIPWFAWDGTEKEQPLIEVLPKRLQYDLFQNVSCPATTQSKFTCNTNVQLITDGPLAMYQFKCGSKATQKDDCEEHDEVHKSMKAMTGRKHDGDRSEAVRLVCRAAFAHNSSNVCAASMASYLTRKEARFFFSHQFAYCPLRDLVRLQQRKPIPSTVEFAKDYEFFENSALHYLCRPLAMENLSPKEFCENFEVKKRPRNDNPDDYHFVQDTGHYKHPCFHKKSGRANQIVKARMQPILVKVSQWSFPDTATFKDNIETCPLSKMTNDMERYARQVLTLLMPHRSAEDFKPFDQSVTTFPYTRKLQEVCRNDQRNKEEGKFNHIVISDDDKTFLQNLQDSAHNCTRYNIKDDDLQRNTEPFRSERTCAKDDNDNSEDEEEKEEEPIPDALPYEMFMMTMAELDDPADVDDLDPALLNDKMQNFTFTPIKDSGKDGCGTAQDINVLAVTEDTPALTAAQPQHGEEVPAQHRDGPPVGKKKEYKARDIVKLIFRRVTRRARADVFKNNPEARVCEATGTVTSIVEWAEKAGLDPLQTRAFLCICAAFVLTFFDGMADDNSTAYEKLKFNEQKKNLTTLRGCDENLICLLHGPGGSGKSTCIELVIEHARDFCSILRHPFTSRTIVVCAMSGVAATLLMGETAHGVLGLNRKNVEDYEIQEHADCRMVIIDEISFASAGEFELMDKKLRQLCQKKYEKYGGMNIVFAGDFSQLEPVKKTPIYKLDREVPEFHDFLNALVELDGMHRFRDDPRWGHVNMRFRVGRPTVEDINEINENCYVGLSEEELPVGIQVACHTNKDRDAINAAVFEKYCKQNGPSGGSVLNTACIVFMDGLAMKNGKETFTYLQSNTMKRYFWENCGEDDCDTVGKRGRVDPALKLYYDCPLMYTQNNDVLGGQANGSRVLCRKLNLHTGEHPFVIKLKCGTKILGVYASQVRSLTVKHENENILPALFEVKPKEWGFRSRIKDGFGTLSYLDMKGLQIPLISNTATTGHKLQGCTLKDLLVNGWCYGQNWAYVVLSRVRTMKGLRLREKLSLTLKKYKMNPRMVAMMEKLKREKTLPEISESTLSDMLFDEAEESDDSSGDSDEESEESEESDGENHSH